MPDLTEDERNISYQMGASAFDRARFVSEWQMTEASLYDIGSEGSTLRVQSRVRNIDPEGDVESNQEALDNFMGINYSARNKQLIFSQVVSNAPVAMGIPTSNEESAKDASEVAEALITYTREQYHLDTYVAKAVHECFDYGTGFLKQVFNKKSGIYIREDGTQLGEHQFSSVTVWDMFIDANAKSIYEIKWMAQRIYMTTEEGLRLFGGDIEPLLSMYKTGMIDAGGAGAATGYIGVDGRSLLYNIHSDQFEIFERWEIGMESNGFKGRLLYHLRDGRILKDCGDSPCRHSMFKGRNGKTKIARLPFSILTYEDVPNTCWGRTPAAKCTRAQQILNACMMIMIQVARNAGIPRLIINKASLGTDTESPVTDDGVDIIELDLAGIAGGTPAYHLQPANTSNDMKDLIQRCEQYIDATWGVNDAMLGKQQRETQGITMQISVMQGNMIREAFYNKYVDFIKDCYKLELSDIKENWTASRIQMVLGENSGKKADSFLESSIAGGFTLHVEKNMTIALDPITRQEQIMNLQPLFEKAQLDPRYLLKQLRLSDLRSIYDKFELADNRAKRQLESVKDKGKVPTFSKYEDHIGIISYLNDYIMTEEFNNLDEDRQKLVEELIDAHSKAAASLVAGGAGGPQPTGPQGPMKPLPGQAPPGMPPVVPPMAGSTLGPIGAPQGR